MINIIREHLKKCPHLEEFSKLGVDFLDKEAVNYSIEILPSEPILKKYVDGGSIRQVDFVISSRLFYGDDISVNIENLGLFEKITEWLDENNKDLPLLGEGKEAIGFETTSSGYLFDSAGDTAKYQIQCKFIFKEDKKWRI